MLLLAAPATAAEPAPRLPAAFQPDREILVPFEELNLILHENTSRVLLSREEYNRLLDQAKKQAEQQPPCPAVLASAEFRIRLAGERALVEGRLALECMTETLTAIEIPLSGIGLKSARLDDKAAALGLNDKGGLVLFVQGRGSHSLTLDAVAPLRTTAAQQTLNCRLPCPPATRLLVVAPGDVELKSGAAVVSRAFDAQAGETRLELLARPDLSALVFSLNSRQKRSDLLVLARSVLVSEIRESGETLQAAISFDVRHGAVSEFRTLVPGDFEITDVQCANLSHWAVDSTGPTNLLCVTLREETTGKTVLNLSATRKTPPPLDPWTFPIIEPLDVAAGFAVVGVTLDDRLQLYESTPVHLIPMDRTVLAHAVRLPPPEAGMSGVRPLLAFYAPQSAYALSARFRKEPARLEATDSTVFTVSDEGLRLRAQIRLAPLHEPLFNADLTLPAGWKTDSVRLDNGAELTCEFTPLSNGQTRVHIPLPKAIQPGRTALLEVMARHTPDGWFQPWDRREFTLPALDLSTAQQQTGAIAIDARDDILVLATNLAGLWPLDEADKTRFGMPAAPALPAYRYEGKPFTAWLEARRQPVRMTAETFSFLNIEPDTVAARYELTYSVEQARTRSVSFLLPSATPRALSIRGLSGTDVTEFTSEETGPLRRWTVRLAALTANPVRICAECRIPLRDAAEQDFDLPLPKAEAVGYQSGFLALEGSSELDIRLAQTPREVDAGELAEAEYRPGRRLLGAYGFVGEPPALRAAISRRTPYALPPAAVQRGELRSVLSANGRCQSLLRCTLRTRAPFLAVALPPGATLWSALVNEAPARPQARAGAILLSLPAESATATISVAYESPIDPAAFHTRIDLQTPALFLIQEENGKRYPLPVADLGWHVYLPTGFRILRYDGDFDTQDVRLPVPSAVKLAQGLYAAAGGIDFRNSLIRGCMLVAGSATSATRMRASKKMGGHEYDAGAYDQRIGAESRGESAGEDISGRLSAMAPACVAPPEAKEDVSYIAGGAISAKPAKPKKSGRGSSAALWGVEGARSLKIDLAGIGAQATFRSLGAGPNLAVTLVDNRKLNALQWALGLAMFLLGAAKLQAPAGRKARFVLTTLLVSTLLPAIPGLSGLTLAMNAVFFAGCALIPFYLVCRPGAHRTNTAALLLLAVLLSGQARPCNAEDAPDQPVQAPADALLVPYKTNPADATQVLLPYDKYKELQALAHPEAGPKPQDLPARVAVAGTRIEATLADEDSLLLFGRTLVRVFAEGDWQLPLLFQNCALEQALLDGKPAPLRATAPTGAEPRTEAQLLLSSIGEHTLEFKARIKLAREGGWRVANARVSASPATTLRLAVPQAATEVSISQVTDRAVHNTSADNETIETALGPEGRISLRWRPRVSEGEKDRTLTADSTCLVEVREDGVKLAWAGTLSFRGGSRKSFDLALPPDYMVEEVTGRNVRGWELDGGRLRVTLLEQVEKEETLTVHLWRHAPAIAEGNTEVDLAAVSVPEAARHTGRLILRRSPLLELRTLQTEGARRIDQAENPQLLARLSRPDESPLGLNAFQTYEFTAEPARIRVAVQPLASQIRATATTLWRIGRQEQTLETRLSLDIRDRPLQRLQLLLPQDAEIDELRMPAEPDWSVRTLEDGQVRATIHFASGLQGTVSAILRCRLPAAGLDTAMRIPRIRVLGAEEQTGDIVIQTEPAFDAQAEELINLESLPLKRVLNDVRGAQRDLVRLALHYKQADFYGSVRLHPRTPAVSSYSVTNLRVTDRSIEETILIDLTIRNAGIREVRFLLPAHLAEAKISVPLLRRKTVSPLPDSRHVQVVLELQDEIMNQLRILVEADRLLTGDRQTISLPTLQTGEVKRQYLALENAGRDEVAIAEQAGLDPLSRQQGEWAFLQSLLHRGVTAAFVTRPDAQDPSLTFQTRPRAAVKTAGGRIGLARTLLMLDSGGAYRGSVTYHVDNRTEPYLEVLLPQDARIWTAQVAGEPVKPALADAKNPAQIRIPLVKTAEGDLDYTVVLKYGGTLQLPATLGAVDFPLVRTANIDVEISHVELLLPKTRQWFHFSGTLEQAKNEQVLTADTLQYQTRILERLTQTVQFGNEFEKARAGSNLRSVSGVYSAFQNEAANTVNGEMNQQLQAQTEKAELALREADQRLKENAQLSVREEGKLYNRTQLSDAYLVQSNAFAEGGDLENIRNWDDALSAPQAEPTGASKGFEEGWLQSNLLKQEEPAADKREDSRRNQPLDSLMQQSVQQAAEPQASAQFTWAEDADNSSSMAGKTASRRGQKDLARQYAQELNGAPDEPTPIDAIEGDDENDIVKSPLVFKGIYGSRNPGARGSLGNKLETPAIGNGVVEQPPAPTASLPANAGALQSLDIEFPAWDPTRWSRYLFTTPRGDIAVRGYAVSRSVVDAALRIGIVLAAAVLLLAHRLARRRRQDQPDAPQPRRAPLGILCILCLLTGILPMAALVVLFGLLYAAAIRKLRDRRKLKLPDFEG